MIHFGSVGKRKEKVGVGRSRDIQEVKGLDRQEKEVEMAWEF